LNKSCTAVFQLRAGKISLQIQPLVVSYHHEDVAYDMKDNYDYGGDTVDNFDERVDDLGHINDNVPQDSSNEGREMDTHKGSQSSDIVEYKRSISLI
jgi:hypothetical protein